MSGRAAGLACVGVLAADAVARGPLGLDDGTPEPLQTIHLVAVLGALLVLGATLRWRLWLVAIATPVAIGLLWAAIDSPPALLGGDTPAGVASALIQTGIVYGVVLALGALLRLPFASRRPRARTAE